MMFKKLRCAYHMSVLEKMIKNYEYIDHETFELTERYKYHKKKLYNILYKK